MGRGNREPSEAESFHSTSRAQNQRVCLPSKLVTTGHPPASWLFKSQQLYEESGEGVTVIAPEDGGTAGST